LIDGHQTVVEFRNEADRRAADADFRALTEHAVRKYHGNEENAAEQLREIVMAEPRLQALAVSKYVIYIVENDPLIQKHLAKTHKRRVAAEKETVSKK
jgi:hypothetical protein